MKEVKSSGVRLLKKGKRGIMRTVFSRFGLILTLLIVQVCFIFWMFFYFEEHFEKFYGLSVIFAVFMVLVLINSPVDPTSKITWLIIISIFPIFGVLLYIYTQSEIGHRALKARVSHINSSASDLLVQSSEAAENLKLENSGAAALAKYVRRSGAYPVYQNTSVKYFSSGEEKFAELLIKLEKAEKFIFLEYFIIDEGEMWGQILDILIKKASQGLDVRVMYDGSCEFAVLPHDYPERIRKFGIKCKMFAPLSPFVSTHYNYRDHRKILVIDGHTAFNGGINLADEYINRKLRFGHWKDTAVMVEGEAVQSFTLMFLEMWAVNEKKTEFEKFIDKKQIYFLNCGDNGFVMPYGDCPLDNDKVGERVYIDILNRAQHYVHIMTPYLILDSVMENTIKFASERGVEVSLILPGIPDKKIPYALAKTHYASLMESGVKIYEYTPGFVHAKVFVADDREAVVGTINLDYRSLYHHFECATYMYGTSCIKNIEADFRQTSEKCKRVTAESIKKEKLSTRFIGFVMKSIAPLL